MAGPPVLIYRLPGGVPMRTARATLIGFFAVIYAVTVAANAVLLGVPGRDWLIAPDRIAPRRPDGRGRGRRPGAGSARRGRALYARRRRACRANMSKI